MSSKLIVREIEPTGNELPITGNIIFDNSSCNSHLPIPSGTTDQRPVNPERGYIRWNYDLNSLEYYNGSNWRYCDIYRDNQNDIVKAGLVHHTDPADPYSYPKRDNYIFDLSGYEGHGILKNGPFYSSADYGSIQFDGSNDGIQINNTSQLSVNQHSICQWNFSTSYENRYMFIFEKTTNGSVNTQYSFFFNADNRIYYRTYGLNITDMVVTTTTSGIVNNRWNYCVATFDGSVKRIYINGALVNTQTVSGTLVQNTTGPAYIGVYGNFGGYYWNGRISNTMVYNRALSDEEILQNYNALRGRYGV